MYAWCSLLLEFLENSWNFEIFFSNSLIMHQVKKIITVTMVWNFDLNQHLFLRFYFFVYSLVLVFSCSQPQLHAEIETEISTLNSSKSTGPFSIPTKLLLLIKSVISKPLEIIYNYSFTTGIVPDKCKLARVFPIFKNGQKPTLVTIVQSHSYQFSIKFWKNLCTID